MHHSEIGAIRSSPRRRQAAKANQNNRQGIDDGIKASTTIFGTHWTSFPLGSATVEVAVLNWKLAYAIGFHPWEDTDQPFARKILELFEREEKGREPPYGLALDLGTGSGIWGIELARRGWEVTGIDIVDKALERAQARIQKAGIDMRLVRGDVTELKAADIGTGFRLVLDTGTFHDLSSAQREAMGRGVNAIAAPDATVLLLAWPKRRRPLIRGVSRDEIEAAFPGWSVTDVEPSYFSLPKILDILLKPDEHWYRLRRL